jgi:hypothetical protein
LLYLDSVDMREWEKPAHPSKLKKKCNYETPYCRLPFLWEEKKWLRTQSLMKYSSRACRYLIMRIQWVTYCYAAEFITPNLVWRGDLAFFEEDQSGFSRLPGTRFLRLPLTICTRGTRII